LSLELEKSGRVSVKGMLIQMSAFGTKESTSVPIM